MVDWGEPHNPSATATADGRLYREEIVRLTAAEARAEKAVGIDWKFQLGDRVTKIKGSSWTGRVVGFYGTSLTPRGYAVESETETGSVQIYPEVAVRALASLPKESADV